jgi:ubiquinone/menaquinone biosynthesis C-methylase UbiE
MRQTVLDPCRRRLVSRAEGQVLELGIGSGLNLEYYGPRVTRVIGLDRSAEMLAKARETSARGRHPVTLIEASGEAIPLADASVDTVVTTWTLCSIPDVAGALAEARRALRPGGQLLFVEHGRSPDSGVTRWQDRLTPLWRRLAGGCHLNRPIRELVEAAGFRIEEIEVGYLEGPKVLTFMYEGRARVGEPKQPRYDAGTQ